MLLVPPSLSSFSNFEVSIAIIPPIENSEVSLAYSPHSPIVITRDSDFVSQGWPGEGTSSAPYSILNLNITSTSSVCILIANTTSYFTIENCWFSSQDSNWGQGIITLENVFGGRIRENEFAAGYIAISVEDSSSCSFTRNSIGTSLMGFLAYNLHDSEFSDNTQISESMGYPVRIEACTNVNIIDNFFQDCLYEGIGLTDCTNCYAALNTLSATNQHNGQYGFALRNSIDCTLTQNNVTLFGTAIEITGGRLYTISDNYIDGCWGGITVRGNDTIISNNEIDAIGFCVQLINSFGSIVNSNELRGYTFATGIDISCGGNSQVTENTISDLEFGMRLQGIDNLDVSNNSFLECYVAITFEELAYLGLEDGPPVNSRILNNQLESCGFRFSITNPVGMNQEISGNLIDGRQLAYLYNETNLQIDGREYGQIILADCEDVSITGGILDELLLMFCTNCQISGVSVSNRTNGVYVRYSSQIDIGYSQLAGNEVGIRIEGSDHCHIVGTNTHNNGHGLLLDSSPNSTIYDCDVYDNEYGMVLIGAHQSYVETNRVYGNGQGIYLLRTTDSYIGNNDVLENDEIGLLLNRGSRYNTIVANSFGWNLVNVLCSGFDNTWDDGVKRGNSWSDLGDSRIYIIDEDDFDRFPSSLGDENFTTTSASTSTTTNNTVAPESVAVVVGAVSGFSLLSIIAFAMHFGRKRTSH